jgi:replicative DNA helicase
MTPKQGPPLKIPPNNIEAEQAVLCGCFLEPRIIPQVQQILTEDDFYRSSHQLIFRGITELRDLLEPVVFGEWATSKGLLDKIGGVDYLATILEAVSTSGAWKYHAEIIKTLSQRRQLIATCSNTLERAFSQVDDLISILSDHKTAIRDTQAERRPAYRSMAELVNITSKLIEARAAGKLLIAHKTGFEVIDTQIQGLEPSCTYYLGAPSHTGKSALALNIARNVASQGLVLYFILESTDTAQTFRLLANQTGIPLTRLRLGKIYGDSEWEDLSKALNELSDTNLLILDQAKYAQFDQLQSLCETLAMENDLRLVVVDFLQLVGLRGQFQSEHHRFKQITINFNHLAKSLQCPFLILSQLNQENQLKESRDIYSNADHVWRLDRHEESPFVQVIGEKGKDTGKWRGWLKFDAHKMRFEDHFGEPPEPRGRKDID